MANRPEPEEQAENIPPEAMTSKLKFQSNGTEQQENGTLLKTCICSTPAPSENKSRLSGVLSTLSPILKYLKIENKQSPPPTVKCASSSSCLKSTGKSAHHSSFNLSTSHSGTPFGATHQPYCLLDFECLPEITLLDDTNNATIQLTTNDSAYPQSTPLAPKPDAVTCKKESNANSSACPPQPAGTQKHKIVELSEMKSLSVWNQMLDGNLPEITFLDISSDSATSTGVQMSYEDLGQNVTQDIMQDLAQDIIQDVELDMAQDKTQDIMQDVELDVAQDKTQDIVQDVELNRAQDKTQDIMQDVELDVAQDIMQDVEQDKTQDIMQDVKLDMVQDKMQDLAQDMVHNKTQDIMQDVELNRAHDKTQDIMQDVELNRAHDKTQDIMQDVELGSTQDKMQDLTQNKTQDIVHNKTQDIKQDVLQNKSQDLVQEMVKPQVSADGGPISLQNDTFDCKLVSDQNGTITLSEMGFKETSRGTLLQADSPKVCNVTTNLNVDTSAVLHPELPEHNGTPDSAETRPKMVENPKGIFETPPGLELLSGGDGCQRECHSQSVLHVSMELSDSSIVSSMNANKTNTLNLDKTLDSVPDPRSSSTPMIDLKMFNLKTQRNEGQVLTAQKKLYPDGRSMPADQVPSEIPSNVPSNIVADRKTFLSQASSKLLWPPSMATSQLPKISNAYLGSKSTVPRKPEPLQSNLPMKRQRIQDAVKKPAPTEGPHRITEKQNSSSLSTRTAVFKLPVSGIQRPQASKVTLVGKPAFPVRKLPTRINSQLLANADKPCGSKDAVKQLLSTESSSRILKPPAVKQKPLLTKPQRQGCSNCRVLEEQLKLKTEEIKRLQEELLTYTKKPKGSS